MHLLTSTPRLARLLGLAAAFIASNVQAGASPAVGGYYNEAYRPAYHFTPAKAWMNDPNGMVYHNGLYHLFYQYHPNSMVWGPMHWGHAVSRDLTHWQHRPIALQPDKLGWIFSGSAVIDKTNSAGFGKDAMVAIFTYHNDEIWKQGRKNTESQALAYSTDEGVTWTKYVGNPVLNNSGEQDFRDPKVFWHEPSARWNMVLAVGDRIRIFSSADLKQWQFESDFKPEEPGPALGVWECPDLFALTTDDGRTRWVMIVNHGDKAPNGGSGTRYFIGDYDGRTFRASQAAQWLDSGSDFYAGVTFENTPNQARVLMAWMSNWQYAAKVPTSPWRSAMTLPRTLHLVAHQGGYRLRQRVAADIKTLATLRYRALKPELPFERKKLDLSRADVRFDVNKAAGLDVRIGNSRGEFFHIYQKDGKLYTDRRQSGQTAFSASFAQSPQVMPMAGERIANVRLLIDRSSVEILINDGLYSMTNLVFPSQPYTDLRITGASGEQIRNLRVDTLSRIWPYTP